MAALTIAVAIAYVVRDTGSGVWTTSAAPREVFGVVFLLLVGAVLATAAWWRPTELRAGILFAASLIIAINGLFAGGNLDLLGGLLGIPAMLGIVGAGFALIESPRWWRAAVYFLVCGALAVGLLLGSYVIAAALGPYPGY